VSPDQPNLVLRSPIRVPVDFHLFCSYFFHRSRFPPDLRAAQLSRSLAVARPDSRLDLFGFLCEARWLGFFPDFLVAVGSATNFSSNLVPVS
jgi:hypothetical protein